MLLFFGRIKQIARINKGTPKIISAVIGIKLPLQRPEVE